MATWFAQTTGNINAANMWNSNPGGGGTVLTWPPASGDVLVANGKTVTLNVNTDLGPNGEIRNDTTGGATAGGFFGTGTTSGLSITANIPVGGTLVTLYQHNRTGTVSIVGNITSTGGTPQNLNCIANLTTGTINITGNINSSFGAVANAAGGTINITGNITSTGAGGTYAVDNGAGGTVNVTGTVTDSGTGTATGFQNRGVGTINLTGNASHTGAGTRGCIYNSSTGTATVSGFVQASNTAPGAENTAQGILQVGETRSASNGLGAVTGAFRFASATAAKTMPYTPDGQISMTVLDVAAIVPAESDVRKSVIYGDGAYTGTLQLGRNRTSMAGRF
jgi:hypothetical protein